MTRRLIGALVSLLALLIGLWLVLAPFALGFQPENRDWTDNTLTDVWTGIPLAVVGLVGVVVFAMALRVHMLQAGYITPKPKAAPATAQQETTQAPVAENSSDTDQMLRPLLAALARDMAREEESTSTRPVETAHHREYGTSALGTETGAQHVVTR